MSTDTVAGGRPPVTSADLDEAWELSRSVALRPEPFGALAYHFGNRRLIFLKRRELVDVVRGLGDAPDVRTALTRAGVPAGQWAAYVRALRGLAEADVIRHRDPVGETG
ncbi:mycofactocin biosynthesis chaperone MftB [Parafrankia sp. EAN1pec]|uniref:mycofactocin biosynthesis chaperone MftB n=1 Tax=Parafrankia sp. (strain EAN1pec) TaxID=298653 RepID=UPI00321BC9DA